ncbi:MAG: hypothetical protein AAGH15_15795 [Myxococcota bacterium]
MKDYVSRQRTRLLQDPRVKVLMQDERVLRGLMKAIRLRGELLQAIDARIEDVAGQLNLATKKEVRELKRSLRKLENELQRARAEGAREER